MLKQVNFKVTGMHCNSCVTLITMELSEIPGVTGVVVDLKTGIGNVTLTEKISDGEILAAVERAGYSASIVKA